MVRVVRNLVIVLQMALVELETRVEDLFSDKKLSVSAEGLVV